MSKAVLGYVAAAGCLSAVLWNFTRISGEKLSEGATVGPVEVGGLTPDAARVRLNQWWDGERSKSLKFSAGDRMFQASLASLNVRLDTSGTLAAVPRATLWGAEAKPASVRPILDVDEKTVEKLNSEVPPTHSASRPARVVFKDNEIQRSPEEPRFTVDAAALPNAIARQIGFSTIELPVVMEKKRVSDDLLANIDEVVASYSTRFSTAKKTRCSNIQLAASKLDGHVLLPGDRISFNDTVGRRTVKNGFKIAGVYKNGKHDVDVGGGICQVSTTLYNAALLSNLKVVSRHNHSMPVAYVPLGRDATVDYGVLDLVIENDTDKPIAISSEYHPGLLRFRILGRKQPGLTVKIQTEGRKNWDAGVKTVVDGSLPAGTKKILEKGSQGHSISTYRLLFQDGRLLTKQGLGQSYYKGGQKIIAVGKPASPEVPPQA